MKSLAMTSRAVARENSRNAHLQFLAQPMGHFYQRLAHRLLINLLLAAGLICGSFIALGFAGGADYVLRNFPLACAVALYLAVVFTSGLALCDVAANRLWPSRLAYAHRDVGGQWLVLFSGLALGLWIHQAAFPGLMRLCAQGSDGQLPINVSVVPLWCATLYSCLLTVPMSHAAIVPNQASEAGRVESHLRPARPVPAETSIPDSRPAGRAVPAKVSFRMDGRRVKMPISAISHASIEDHYCRVYYLNNRGLRSILVRETLQGLISQAGGEVFLQIHRSHLVNRNHITAYKRKGGDHWVLLGPDRVPLPVSRRRRKEVKESLADVLPV